jgi:predicted methyltransferase
MAGEIVLSHTHVRPLLHARQAGASEAETSLDLGLTEARIRLEPERVVFPDSQWLHWEGIREVAATESACFLVQDNAVEKIERYSETLSRYYSLMPTDEAPTLMISGIPMHRIKGITPNRDTAKKIRTIAPVHGRVLDTCTGLGYTAIQAARTAERVTTIELDPAVLEVARLNPWSCDLFENPRAEQLVGDAFDEIEAFEDRAFDRIIHDPPTFSLAGELYSAQFYAQLRRVLKRKGRLFHYIGDLESRSGRNVVKGVVGRLKEAGFARVVRRPAAYGVVAYG